MEASLSGILHLATQTQIMRWAYAQDMVVDMVTRWDAVCKQFYALPFEEREKYRVRPTTQDCEAPWNTKEEAWLNAYLNDQTVVRGVVAKYEHDWEDVDDLTHGVYLRAWENLDQWDEESAFRTWLYSVAENFVKDHIKMITAAKRPPLVYEHKVEQARDDDGVHVSYYDRADLSPELRDACTNQNPGLVAEADSTLLSLGEPELIAGRLRGDSNGEIAASMGVSEKTVRNRLSAVKQKVRDNCIVLSSNSVQARTMDELAETQDKRVRQRIRAGEARARRLQEQAELGAKGLEWTLPLSNVMEV